METNFKPKDTPNEYLKFGVYFKSENDISTQYLIELYEGSLVEEDQSLISAKFLVLKKFFQHFSGLTTLTPTG